MTDFGPASLDAWRLVRQMLDDMTATIEQDAETELELVEGLRVLGRITALCSELSLDVDPEQPFFFAMSTERRLVGGVNPDGEYPLAMIDGRHRYRIHGQRGTTAYLGFQVLAGTGLVPRRMAAYVSDRDLEVRADGSFGFVFAATKPSDAELAGDRGSRSPRTRRRSWCASTSPTAPTRRSPTSSSSRSTRPGSRRSRPTRTSASSSRAWRGRSRS